MLTTNSSALPLPKIVVEIVHAQYDAKVQTIRLDNDFELGKSIRALELFSTKGILH